ncbi:MAG: FtsH protease activity modulator HflK [Gammaproteobacteria bacterium]|nr:FtsH protease activity modulator HflK [Gammaproteobacteria bacterium]MBK8133838.1 FtsH protease activity modulator HflK [Gammaproteobacteria bacterium]
MAWNEPGDGRDPWGSGKKASPSDLDAVLKRFSDRLNQAFGGGGGNGGGLGRGPLVMGLMAIAVLWFALGWYQVDAQEQAVVLRFGKFSELTGEGLHWRPRLIDNVTKVAVTTERRYETEPRNEMLTEDENIVELPLTVQYNVNDAKAFVLNVKDPELSLREATDSAVRHEVGNAKFDAVISTGRGELSIAVAKRLQTYLDQYGTGIRVVKVNIREAKPPAAVRAAYDNVVKAREYREQVINEAQSYANGVVPEARGRAQRTLAEASAYREKAAIEATGEAQRFERLYAEYQKAPAVTRQRLYMETLEEVMAGTPKVIVDMKTGGNMIYLPIDKLVQTDGTGATTGDRALSNQQLNDIANRAADVLRRQVATSTTPRREGR